MQGVRGGDLPAPAPKEHMQGVRGRASASTSAKGANTRGAGGRASASTSAAGANARIAARRRTRRCRPAWRSSRGQRMLLVKTCDVSHGPHVTDGRRQTSVQSQTTSLQLPKSVQGVRGGEHLPAPAPKEPMQGVPRGGRHFDAGRPGGARGASACCW
jgi:hypothetical protein